MRLLPSILMSAMLLLAACAQPEWAPDEAVTRAHYSPDAPPSIALMTMVRTSNGAGGHSALMINGSERVIFDPAGTWRNEAAPERNDVIFGITPQMLEFYLDYHARQTYHVDVYQVQVTPEVAEMALKRVEEYGAVPKLQCSNSVSQILNGLPGFEAIGHYWRPEKTMADFASLPGVTLRRVFDDDADDNKYLLAQQVVQATANLPATAN